MPGLDDAKQAFINAMVAAMESGSGGNKTTVATNMAAAIKTFVKAAVVETTNDVSGLVTGISTGEGSPS